VKSPNTQYIAITQTSSQTVSRCNLSHHSYAHKIELNEHVRVTAAYVAISIITFCVRNVHLSPSRKPATQANILTCLRFYKVQ